MASAINLSNTPPELDGAGLDQLIALYLTDVQLRQVAPSTLAHYAYCLGFLRSWWAEAGPGLGYRLNPASWALFSTWLQSQRTRTGRTIATSTRRACLARARQLLRWAYRWDYIDRDFSHQLPQVKGSDLQRQGPDLDQLRALLEAAGQSRRPVRDQALIALFAGTGIRRAEAAGLDVGDALFHADGGGVLTVRRGKGDKPRRVAFDGACGRYLAALLDELGRSDGPLFVGWHNRRLSAHSVYAAVKAAMGRAGIDERGRGPHDLRRLFATEWARRRRGLGDGQALALQMGHTSEKMALHYSRFTFDDLQEGFVSPLAALGDGEP